MPDDHAAWEGVLRIPGAYAVTVTAIETRKVLWSAWTEPSRGGAEAARVAAAMAEAAVELVRLTDSESGVEDLLVIGPTLFHLLRVASSDEPGGQVAHLVLDRRRANLALARREFKEACEEVPVPAVEPGPTELPATKRPTGPPAAGPPATGPPATGPRPAGPRPTVLRPIELHAIELPGIGPVATGPPAAAAAPVAPVAEDTAEYPIDEPVRAALPKRVPARWVPRETANNGAPSGMSGWLAAAVPGPYGSDDVTLNRVREGLRRLR